MYCSRLAVLAVLLSGCSYADPITFTHTGVGSGTIGTTTFTDAAFTITDVGDTTNVEDLSGAFSLDDSSASIAIDGVGTFDFITGTRTFVAGGLVGFSRATASGNDLFNGPSNAAFSTWDLTSSIGPIDGTAQLLQWSLSPVDTSGGVLVFDDGITDTVFSATLGTAVPEPTGSIAVGIGVLALAVVTRRRRKRSAD